MPKEGNDMVKIRPMTKEDCEAVFAIDRACFADAWSLKMFEELFQYSVNYYFVAEDVDGICGFAGITTSVDTADVMNIGVMPERRKEGIGQELLEVLIQQAKECECEQIMLEVRESNLPAIALYKKNGFQAIAVRKNYYTQPTEHGIIMQRSLE